jgi:hypothetical protein
MTEGIGEQRPVSARILTPRGWIRGTFHPPRAVHLSDYLDHAGQFVSLTDVTPEGGQHALEYLSLQRAAMTLIIPEDTVPLETVRTVNQTLRRHHVYVMLAEGSLTATLDVLTQVRVSDFFANRSGFVVLHEVDLRVTPPIEGPGPLPSVLLNTDRTLGVAELNE